MDDYFELKKLADSFLSKWPVERIKNMTLEEYHHCGNKDTFCYWLVEKTANLGSIKGSFPKGAKIYEKKQENNSSSRHREYSWNHELGKTKEEAFSKVKEMILEVIEAAIIGDYSKIESINWKGMFIWKIAFMYSNEGLIPIYDEKILQNIAKKYAFELGENPKISEIQIKMMETMPRDSNVYYYMRNLLGINEENNNIRESIVHHRKENNKPIILRKESTEISTKIYTKHNHSSCVVRRIHSLLQDKLYKDLMSKYSKDNVKCEEDFVDIKLIEEDSITFYEIKTCKTAYNCIREGLGQILLYSIRDTDIRPKKIVIVGSSPANKEEKEYIKKIKETLRLDFEYKYVELDNKG